jgi:hypothetical protein
MSSQGYGYRLGRSDASRFEGESYDIFPHDRANGEHLEAIGRLHDAETHRIARPRADLAALLSLPKVTVLLAARQGEIAGYLVHGKGMNKVGLLEGGGDSAAIGALIREMLSSLGPEDTLQVQAPLSPSPLGRLMASVMRDDRLSIEEAALAGYQMIRINSLEGLLRGMTGYLQEHSQGLKGAVGLKCTDSGEAVTISLDDGDVDITAKRSDDSLELSRRQLAALIFGHHDSVEPPPVPSGTILDRLFPFYFPVWALDRS